MQMALADSGKRRFPGASAKYGYGWMKAIWTEPDPFAPIRRSLDEKNYSDQAIVAEAERLHRLPDPKSSRDAYRLAYFSHRNTFIKPSSETKQAQSDRAGYMLAENPVDHSAEYARMRFLIEQWQWIDPKNKPVARRLVQKFPNQPVLRRYLANNLRDQGNTLENDEAVKILEELVREHPGERSYFISLAGAVGANAFRRHDKVLHRQALNLYLRARLLPGISKESLAHMDLLIKAHRAGMEGKALK